MAFNITIKSVNVEKVTKGKRPYSVAQVEYADSKGETRVQKVMSFSNPDVFKQASELNAGDQIAVEVVKNAGGFNEWAKITAGGVESVNTTAKSSGGNWETAQERAENRARIVRQSSLGHAVSTLGGVSTGATVDEILNLAEKYFDWVYEADDQDEAD